MGSVSRYALQSFAAEGLQNGFPLPSGLNGLFLMRGFLGRGAWRLKNHAKRGHRLKTPQNGEAEPRAKYGNNREIRKNPIDYEKTLICKGCVMRQLRKRLKKD